MYPYPKRHHPACSREELMMPSGRLEQQPLPGTDYDERDGSDLLVVLPDTDLIASAVGGIAIVKLSGNLL